jgi:protein O-mannosyl-transferase
VRIACALIAAWGNLANVLNAQGKSLEAEAAYKAALSFRSNMADVHYNL